MTANEAISAAISAKKTTQAATAKLYGWSAQQLGQRIKRKTLRADEFMGIMDVLGIDVIFAVRETGEVLKAHVSGHGPRLVGMSDGVTYDTDASEAVCNSFFEDGVNEYGQDDRAQELYIDKDGRYFMAEYTRVEGEKNRVRSVPASVAAAFIEKYGNKPDTEV